MASASLKTVVKHLRVLAAGGLSESRLLEQFIDNGDEAAFAALVRRHGRLVFGVCRRILGQGPDCEDAFQATFVVLARKATSIRKQTSLASWLYGVAYRIAVRLKSKAARRRVRENVATAALDQIAENETMRPDPSNRAGLRELGAILDEEMQGLPPGCRDALVICCMEGLSHAEAAQQLGWPLGTLKGRLQRGRELLRKRLERRGVALSVVGLSVALTEQAAAYVPPTLLRTAVQSVTQHAVTATVAALANGAVRTLAAAKMKLVLMTAAAVGMLGFGAVGLSFSGTSADIPRDPAIASIPSIPAQNKVPDIVNDIHGDPLPPGAIARLGTIRLRPSSTCYAVAFSPSGDSLISACYDGVIRFWDTTTGKETRRFKELKRGWGGLALSPNGKLLAAQGGEPITYVWDVATGKELHRFPGDQVTGLTSALVFAPNSDVLAVAGAGIVKLWDVKSGKELRSIPAGGAKVQALAFSPDGKTIAAVDGKKTVYLWEADTGNWMQPLLGERDFEFSGIAFTKDSKQLIAVAYFGFSVWDVASGKKVTSTAARGQLEKQLALSPDGKLLAVESRTHGISLWDWAAGKEIRGLDHRASSHGLAYSHDGKMLASAAEGAIRIWDVDTGKPRGALAGHQERMSSVAYTPDGANVVTEGWDGTVRLWDAKTSKELARLDVPAQGPLVKQYVGHLRRIFMAPDGKSVAIARADEAVVIWDLETHKTTHQFQAGSVGFSPDGKLVACGERSVPEDKFLGLIRLYDRATGKQCGQLAGHPATIGFLTFTPDSKVLLSQARSTPLPTLALANTAGDPKEQGVVGVWSVAGGKELKSFPAHEKFFGLVMSPDGRTLASTTFRGKSIPLWERLTGKQRGELAEAVAHHSDVAFSPDGRTVALPSEDGYSVLILDLHSGAQLAVLEGHLNHVTSVAFSPDGKSLVSGSLDTTALIWDVSRLTQRKAIEITPAALEACWTEFGSDARRSFAAIGRMLSSPKQSLGLLRDRLKPVTVTPEAKRIAEIIAQLDSDNFKTRDAATKELAGLGELARQPMEKALTAKVSLEMKQRLEALLDKLEGANLPPDTLRQIRAVEVLEYLGIPEAGELLAALAAGTSEARLTQEAQAAMGRLATRVKIAP